MNANGRRVVIVGGGIAGLSAAIYALQCGYKVVVLEQGEMAGGLAMSWERERIHLRDVPALVCGIEAAAASSMGCGARCSTSTG